MSRNSKTEIQKEIEFLSEKIKQAKALNLMDEVISLSKQIKALKPISRPPRKN